MHSMKTGAYSHRAGFRLDSWTASLDAGMRQRHLRYRYMETLSRKLSRDIDSRGSTFPDCMTATHRWWSRCSATDGAYANFDEIKSWSDDVSGLRPSRTIDHVASKSLDDLSGASPQPSAWTSFHHGRKVLPERRSPLEVTSKSDLHATTSKQVEDEVFIDPITNRRVPRPTTAAAAASHLEHQTLGKNTLSSKAQEVDGQFGRNTTAVPKFEPKTERPSGPVNFFSASPCDTSASREQSHMRESWRPKRLPRKHVHVWKGPGDSLQPVTPKEPKASDHYFNKTTDNHPAPSQPTVELGSKNPGDFTQFKPSSVAQSTAAPLKPSDEFSKRHEDSLERFGSVWDDSHGICRPVSKESPKKYAEVDKHTPFCFNEPKDQESWLAEKPELDRNGAVYGKESKRGLAKGSHYGTTAPAAPLMDRQGSLSVSGRDEPENRIGRRAKLKYEDPPKKRPDFDASRRAYAVHRNIASKLYTGLCRDELGSHSKSDQVCSGAAASRPTITDATSTPPSAADRSSDRHLDRTDSTHSGSPDTSRDYANLRTAAEIRSDVLRRAHNYNEKVKLQEAKSEHELNWDATYEDAQDTLKRVKLDAQRTLTGNYVRDFPQEFATSWSTANSPSRSTLFPKNRSDGGQSAAESSDILSMEKDETEPSSMDESFPSEEAKLQPSLDRISTKRSARAAGCRPEGLHVEEDLFSKEPQGLQTSYVTEYGEGRSQPALVKHYKTKTPVKTKDAPGEVCAEGCEKAACYRILAYDAGTGSLSVAETTSGVEDRQPWASPAAILPRLSSPSKFLPHFARLREQGFEIVAGGGDVLIFRKVRAASPEANSKRDETCQVWEAPINPIDLMGKPVTGNFASPTGFVNYDAAAARDDNKPSPPFRTCGGVAAQEGQADKQGRRRGGRRLGRKLVIGTVWVTGIAYAAGVLGEYFATGGADGLGPTGF